MHQAQGSRIHHDSIHTLGHGGQVWIDATDRPARCRLFAPQLRLTNQKPANG